MSAGLEAVRELEELYYAEMPRDFKSRLEQRNKGIKLIQNSTDSDLASRGVDMLAQSAHGLRWAQGLYKREYFASLYMHARGEFLLGERDYAGYLAYSAMSRLPEVPMEFTDFIVDDQYVAIAAGRLSLILSAAQSNNSSRAVGRDYRASAVEAARLARTTCRHSEDRDKMLFTDGEMTESQRNLARRRHTMVAAAATAALWLPHNLTVKLAERFC